MCLAVWTLSMFTYVTIIVFPSFLSCFRHVNPVRNLLRYRDVVQGLSEHFAKSSSGLTCTVCVISINLRCHSLFLVTFARRKSGCTIDRKQFLELRRGWAG